MVSAEVITAAVHSLDQGNDALWNKDDTPKVGAVRDAIKDKEAAKAMSEDDLDEAIGAFKRKSTAPAVVEAPLVPTAAPPGAPQASTPPVDPGPVVATEATSTESDDVQKARAVLQDIEPNINDLLTQREAINNALAAAQVVKDKALTTLEHNDNQMSAAQAVKAVQEQTRKTLAAQAERAKTAMAALGPFGGKPYPSALDAHLANRKKTPEQKSMMAQHIHQRAAERNEKLQQS